jgi:hypothetical protein
MHDEAVAASSTPGDTAGRYSPYESADSYVVLGLHRVLKGAKSYIAGCLHDSKHECNDDTMMMQ